MLIDVITIDGLSGVGKTTAALAIAEQLGYNFLSSGMLYRMLAWLISEKNVDVTNTAELEKYTAYFTYNSGSYPEGSSVELKNNLLYWQKHGLCLPNIKSILSRQEYGDLASKIAAFPVLRTFFLEPQRSFAIYPGLVSDGRDMGTVVFPQAKFKFFLIASSEVRALRRQKELLEQGIAVDLKTLQKELEERDQRDKTRPISPLVPAEDAIIIDTTNLSFMQVVQFIIDNIQSVNQNC